MTRPALLAVAHGSADPAAQRTIAALADRVRALAPGVEVRLGFIQHGEPSLPAALAALAGLPGAGSGIVIVPLLLATGYHLTTDIADAAVAAGARVAAPLGPDDLLSEALADRLTEALRGAPSPWPRQPPAGRFASPGNPAGLAVILAAAGSSDLRAQASVSWQAHLLSRRLGVPVQAAFAAAGAPSVPDALAALRSSVSVSGPVAVASYLLAPGRFQYQLTASPADFVTAPIADHPAVARLIIDRYLAACAAWRPLPAAYRSRPDTLNEAQTARQTSFASSPSASACSTVRPPSSAST